MDFIDLIVFVLTVIVSRFTIVTRFTVATKFIIATKLINVTSSVIVSIFIIIYSFRCGLVNYRLITVIFLHIFLKLMDINDLHTKLAIFLWTHGTVYATCQYERRASYFEFPFEIKRLIG